MFYLFKSNNGKKNTRSVLLFLDNIPFQKYQDGILSRNSKTDLVFFFKILPLLLLKR